MRYTMGERLKARARQLGMHAGKVAELARVNRSFVYDIMRGRSQNPDFDKLDAVAAVLKVERNWLIHGMGNVEGEAPLLDNPDNALVAIPHVSVTSSMASANIVDAEPNYRRPYRFQRSWIRHDLKADPAKLRVMQIEGDSMMPTLHDGDVVLVDTGRRSPTPPGIFVLHDGLAFGAKRLELIPNSDRPRIRIISDNPRYAPHEGTADEVNIIGRVRWVAREI